MPQAQEGLYALYLRKSRADLEKEAICEFETLALHEKELTDFAKRNGYVLDKPFYKELVSGEQIAERKQFQELMAKVEKGVYRGVLVHSVTRLGRGNPMEYGWILYVLQRTRTKIITPNKVFDPNDADDARYLQMEMFVSNMELGNIVGRMQGGCRASAKRGCFIKPTPPYGYDRFRNENGQWTLKQNDDAPTVRMIYERAAAGETLGSIAKDMNAKGLRTQCGGFWSAGRLGTIIKNVHYKGDIRYGYWHDEKVLGDGFRVERRRTKRAEGDYIYVKGLHKPIVDAELWQKANDRHNGSAPIKRSKSLKNPLAGLLVCKKCGRSMLRFINTCPSNGNKIEHIRHASFCDCKARGCRLSVVMSVLVEALATIAEDLEACATFGDVDTSEKELEAVERQLKRERDRLEKLFELYFADAITIEEFKERRASGEGLIETLELQRVELSKSRPAPSEVAFTIREAIHKLEDPDVEPQAKNEALRSFIDRIEYENLTERINKQDIRLHIVMKGA